MTPTGSHIAPRHDDDRFWRMWGAEREVAALRAEREVAALRHELETVREERDALRGANNDMAANIEKMTETTVDLLAAIDERLTALGLHRTAR